MTYYVTFRHRRPLDEQERLTLFRVLVRAEGRQLDMVALCVLPEATELLFRVLDGPKGVPELSKTIEAAKRKAGKAIVAATGERWPPFWEESFDRIVRDEQELEEKFMAILESPVECELSDGPEDYPCLFVAVAPGSGNR